MPHIDDSKKTQIASRIDDELAELKKCLTSAKMEHNMDRSNKQHKKELSDMKSELEKQNRRALTLGASMCEDATITIHCFVTGNREIHLLTV